MSAMKLGIHGSVRVGLLNALKEAEEAGCKTLQVLPFPRHNSPTDKDLAAFCAERERLKIEHLIVHSRFVPSLASSDEKRRARSVELLAYELNLAHGLGAESYILHAGAYSEGGSAEDGLRLAADSINRAASPFKGPILVENVPGGGRRLCGTLEELARVRDALKRPSGVCLDTAHGWAAGYELATAEGMLKFLSRAHRLFGDGVRAFHVNDTRALLGSNLENHAHWGEGFLGREGVDALLARPEYADTPGIVETPKEPGADRRNLGFLSGRR
jgi:deoxyribonuclease-4